MKKKKYKTLGEVDRDFTLTWTKSVDQPQRFAVAALLWRDHGESFSKEGFDAGGNLKDGWCKYSMNQSVFNHSLKKTISDRYIIAEANRRHKARYGK